MAPAGVIEPIRLPVRSVNHMFPSGPAVIQNGAEAGFGSGYSLNEPFESSPMACAFRAANQMAPSGATAMPWGRLTGDGIADSVTSPVAADAGAPTSPSPRRARKTTMAVREP